MSKAKNLLDNAVAGFPHDDCYTCECFLGYLTRLELDSEPAFKKTAAEFKPSRELMHSCMGCDPCPPGDHYAVYVQQKNNLIQL
jgi:hypothetical protein